MTLCPQKGLQRYALFFYVPNISATSDKTLENPLKKKGRQMQICLHFIRDLTKFVIAYSKLK